MRLATKEQALRERIIKSVLPEIASADTSKPPAYATTFIHRKVRQGLGFDPFRGIKAEYNEIALGLYDFLKERVRASADPILTASRLAIAGNVIDFGIFTSVDIEGAIKRALEGHLSHDDYGSFREAISKADSVLYLLDNAGEIVFDRVLIESLISIGKKVTAVVKGSPVINDSTMFDAVQSGLHRVCEVVDNGSDAVGTILEMSSPLMRELFRDAPFVISKGQGNFETLMAEKDKNIFFLFQSKCEVVSRELGLPLGAMLLKKGEL